MSASRSGHCTFDKRAPGRARAQPDGTCAETSFRLSPKRTSPYKSAGESVQSTAGSRVCASALVMPDTPRPEVV